MMYHYNWRLLSILRTLKAVWSCMTNRPHVCHLQQYYGAFIIIIQWYGFWNGPFCRVFCWLWMGHMTVHWHLGLGTVLKAIHLNINITLNKRLEFRDARINVFICSPVWFHCILLPKLLLVTFLGCFEHAADILKMCWYHNKMTNNFCKQFFHICFFVFMLFPFVFKQQHSISIHMLDNVPPQNALFKPHLCIRAVGFLENVGIAITILWHDTFIFGMITSPLPSPLTFSSVWLVFYVVKNFLVRSPRINTDSPLNWSWSSDIISEFIYFLHVVQCTVMSTTTSFLCVYQSRVLSNVVYHSVCWLIIICHTPPPWREPGGTLVVWLRGGWSLWQRWLLPPAKKKFEVRERRRRR